LVFSASKFDFAVPRSGCKLPSAISDEEGSGAFAGIFWRNSIFDPASNNSVLDFGSVIVVVGIVVPVEGVTIVL
uniref:Ovule protein n=1 Tax=Brugia timori TaxID=42155 RepID=A0A0R3QEZ4_9BILA